jgi:hypothetical protein
MSWLSTVMSASRENWRRSVKEVGTIAAISLIPLACKAGYYYIKSRTTPTPLSFFDSIVKYIISGDLMFFSIANFAAILWLSAQDFKDRFEERIYFIILSVAGLSVCTFFVGFNPTLEGIPLGILQVASLISFLASLLANTTLLVFEHYSGVDLASNQAHEEDDTAARLARRRAK